MSMRIARVLGLLAAASVGAQLCACSSVQPWVKPYERERLAEPIMSFDRNPISSQYMEHVLDVRAAARGGNGAAGGGCGCN
ncbi:MAG TPA: DUF4266 domain-containing protein [Steroidobacteraceae bacterium]|jgi:hypothetical protein